MPRGTREAVGATRDGLRTCRFHCLDGVYCLGLSGFHHGVTTHRPLSSSFLVLPYRILYINHKKELLRGLWVS